MNKLKGRKTLNNIITQALEPFEITSASLSDEYAYYFDEDSITYTLEITKIDYLYNDFVKENFNYDVTNIFIFSLLHELGHKFNNDDIDGSIYEYCQKEKERLQENLIDTNDDFYYKYFNYQYFSLPDEMLATAWAVDYAKAHPKQIRLMWEKMEKAIKDFYKENNLED